MKRTTTFLALCLGFTTTIFAQEPCSTGRYSSEIYPTVTTTSDVVYGENLNYGGIQNVILKLDFYEATGDTAAIRPLIIWAHGGSFIGGSKTDVDVKKLSQEFAKKGYVCASIDYRLGFVPLDSANAVKAVIRAVQDMRAAVRFFYKDRADGTNTYKIDTNNIFVGGSSAGALTALHLNYLDRTCEINDYVPTANLTALGGLEGNSGNPCYSSKVNGVINLCGGLAKYGWLEAGDLPLCSMHGTIDATVKYNRGIVSPFGIPLLYLDGSRMLHERANAIGVQSNFYTFNGAGHVPFYGTDATSQAYMDTTINFVRDYLIQRLGCTDAPSQTTNAPAETANLYSFTSCSVNVTEDFCTGAGVNELNEVAFAVFPNPTSENMTINFLEEGEMHINLVDFSGRIMLSENVKSQSYILERGSLKNGMYLLKITNRNGITSTKSVVFN